MAETFFYIKQGATLSLEAPNSNNVDVPIAEPPCFFLTTPPEATVRVNPTYQDVPFVASKIKHTQGLIRIFTANVSTWEASEPTYPLLPRVKDQLKRHKKLLKKILCQ